MSTQAVNKCVSSPIRYSDKSAKLWMWSGAPLYWQDKVSLRFEEVDFFRLEPASNVRHWDVLAMWTRCISRRRAIPTPIVSRTPGGTLYIQDGNHRYSAIKICFRNRLGRLRVRVAVVEPLAGFEFVYKQFSTHYTYVLQPIEAVDESLSPHVPRSGVLASAMESAEARA